MEHSLENGNQHEKLKDNLVSIMVIFHFVVDTNSNKHMAFFGDIKTIKMTLT